MKFFTAFVLSTLLVYIAAGQCEVEVGKATAALEWDRTFTQKGPGSGLTPGGSPGWTGGDSTYSLLLPSGETAFFFSDSYIGEWPKVDGDGTVTVSPTGLRQMQINCHPPLCQPAGTLFTARNSIVVRSSDGRTLRTLVGPKGANGFSTSFFAEPAKGLYYWMGDAAIAQFHSGRKVIVFLHKFDAKLEFHGASIGILDPATLAIERTVEVAGFPNNEIHWGTAIHVERSARGETLFIFGKGRSGQLKKAFVAKVEDVADPSHLADAKKWKVWSGNDWATWPSKPASIVPSADSVSDEFSVKKFKVKDRDIFLMSSLDTSKHMKDWSDLTLYSSCRPEGPFVGRKTIYKIPETASIKLPGISETESLNSGMVVYNPHIHPQFTREGSILISYNSNTTNTGDTRYIDAYRPRFIWLPVRGLK